MRSQLTALTLAILLSLFTYTSVPEIHKVTEAAGAPTQCGGAFYGANYVVVNGQEKLYTHGGIWSFLGLPWGHPDRLADRIWVSDMGSGGRWLPPRMIVNNSIFPWMGPDTPPEAYIGAIGTQSVVAYAGRYYMVFTATISDPNICAGEHHAFLYYLPYCGRKQQPQFTCSGIRFCKDGMIVIELVVLLAKLVAVVCNNCGTVI